MLSEAPETDKHKKIREYVTKFISEVVLADMRHALLHNASSAYNVLLYGFYRWIVCIPTLVAKIVVCTP